MKAARFYNKGDIRIEDIPEPTVAPGTVGINVAWCGICGTDLHEFMEARFSFRLAAIHTQSQASQRQLPWVTSSPAWFMP